jgi:modulator of FtsH protease HflC
MSLMKKIMLIIFLLGVFLISASFYTVYEGQRALMIRQSRVIRVSNPGLHWKLPLVDQVVIVDMRVRTWLARDLSVITQDNKPLRVDVMLLWQITDPTLYYSNLNKIRNIFGDIFTQRVKQFLSHKDWLEIQGIRDKDLNALLDQYTRENLGFKVSKIQITHLDVPPEEKANLILKMRREQEELATTYRINYQKEIDDLKSQTKDILDRLNRQTQEEVSKIRASGEIEALKIYVAAYKKDPKLADIYQNLQSDQKIFRQNKNTVFLLQPPGRILRYLDGASHNN